jgi:MFS family permease
MTASFSERLAQNPRYPWYVVGMLWFICFFNYADRTAIGAVLPALQTEFGFNKIEQGYISSAFMVVYALTAPIAGRVSDRTSRKLLIIGGLYVWSLVTGLTAVCSRVWHFVAVRGAEGLGETFYFPASMSLVSDYHTKKTRSRAMSFHQTSVYAGTIGGGMLTGWLARDYGWRVPFILFGALGIALGVVLWLLVREPKRNEAELAVGERVEMPVNQIGGAQFALWAAGTPSLWGLAVAFVSANSVAGVFLAWMPTYLKENFHLDLAAAGLNAVLYVQVGSMVGAVIGGALADRWRLRALGGRMLTQAVGTAAGIPMILLCGQARNLGALAVGLSLFGVCKGIYDSNIWAGLYDVVPPDRRGTAVGLMNLLGWSGGAVATTLIGVAANSGVGMGAALARMSVAYVVATGALLITALVFAPKQILRTASQ